MSQIIKEAGSMWGRHHVKLPPLIISFPRFFSFLINRWMAMANEIKKEAKKHPEYGSTRVAASILTSVPHVQPASLTSTEKYIWKLPTKMPFLF